MKNSPKIYVFTRAFNAERTIRRAIDSVLNQSYYNITYVVRDNGSTDNTYAICKEYAQNDERLILVHNQKNHVFETDEEWVALHLEDSLRYGTALGEEDFFCLLDADDEYLPDFFERAVQLAQKEHLDIVVGGTELIQEETGRQVGKAIHEKTFFLEGEKFSDLFLEYHWHTRQMWGKLYRRHTLLGFFEYWSALLKRNLGDSDEPIPYGADTIETLYAFQRADRVGILSGGAHRYYIQRKSVSSSFPSNRTVSDAILHNATTNFLIAKCGLITPQNRNFLQLVYSNAVTDTVNAIRNASLSPADKLQEYWKITSNPITLAAYRECTDECAQESKKRLLVNALEAGAALSGAADDNLQKIMQTLLPHCGQAVSAVNAQLFLEDSKLLQSLLQDDRETILQTLLQRMEKNQGTSKYAIPKIIQSLATDNILLCQITDTAFLQKYGEIYQKIWLGKNIDALDEMTGLLLENKISSARETFLTLYIALAAHENQASAFIFGKIQLAWLYLQQNRQEDCRSVAADLREMGVENEELNAIWSILEK